MSTAEKIDNRKIRFSDALWASPLQHIVVGGAGGIGSWASLFLSRIGHHIYLYDMDTIDETNMGGQLYGISQIGMNKAEATKANIHTFCGEDANVKIYQKYDQKTGLVTPIMFSCFDNMEARKLMFEKWAAYDKRIAFIDGRMLAEVGNVFCVQKGQEDEYRKFLFSDEEIQEAPCSFKATSHCGAITGSQMVSVMNNLLANTKAGNNDRIVNFQTDFELPMLMVDGYEYTEPKVEDSAGDEKVVSATTKPAKVVKKKVEEKASN